MAKTLGATQTGYSWDLTTTLPLLLTDGAVNYIYGPTGKPIERIDETGNILDYHQDQLGSTRLLSTSGGTVAGTYTYDAYGKPTASTGTVAQPFGYAGEYTDPETGLIYLRARYYDPATGNFLTRDPIVAQTRSAYGYVNGNPLNATDPSGLDSYSNTYNLGKRGTPEQLAAFTVANCESLFPIQGCFDQFREGEELQLRYNAWVYVQGFPVRVEDISATSFTFVALSGHPEGPGRRITFAFFCEDGTNKLRVSTSSRGSANVNWFRLRHTNFWLARRTWSKLASNIRSDYAENGP